jgi:hypothetical protein
LRGLIGLRDDLGHCVDLPQRALAEGANREQAVCDLAARTYHLSIAFDDKTETMRIGAGEPLRQKLVTKGWPRSGLKPEQS